MSYNAILSAVLSESLSVRELLLCEVDGGRLCVTLKEYVTPCAIWASLPIVTRCGAYITKPN